MSRPLALLGEGLHFAWVNRILATLLLALLCTSLSGPTAWAQVIPDDQTEAENPDPPSDDTDEEPDRSIPGPLILEPDPLIPPDLDLPPVPSPEILPELDNPDPETSGITVPDYSRLSSNEERQARLDDMFARLAEAENADDGRLIAEEIWAVWLDSGSASINLVLRRGTQAQSQNRNELARALYDQVTALQPDYAEGWARSSRLALEERDFSRAVSESIRALTIEPRHFYALWTLGNVLERMGRSEEALEAYREANTLYPSLEQVSERVETLELQLDGGVL